MLLPHVFFFNPSVFLCCEGVVVLIGPQMQLLSLALNLIHVALAAFDHSDIKTHKLLGQV